MNIENLIKKEETKQLNSISLIASENITSKRIREALSSCLTNKYAEGYPFKRYYAGCEIADEVESTAIELLKKLFKANWANVQPHSGSQANQAAFFAMLKNQDTILSLDLNAGGHLTHGAKPSMTFNNYKIINYGLNENGFIDMENVETLAKKYKPKMIIAGTSSYSQEINWKHFRKIADLSNSILLADIAHIAGLIAGKQLENPINFAHIITSTTHKTLRGPRGGIILSNNEEIGKKIDKALFPGIQGGPMMNIIAAKAIAFEEALQPEFEEYAKKTIENAQKMAEIFIKNGATLITNGTKNHLMILNSLKSFNLNGIEAQKILEDANVYVSYSSLMNETWNNPSSIRIGTPYITTLGIENIEDLTYLIIETLKTKNNTKLKEFAQTSANLLYKKFI